ncbi:MAG: thiamine pyrophosphate-dependent dehydrogenase E1 component subunit alpha [Actinobacteria bacterium]|nr:thiamine pyrophosphate-dependent dehydrogenase E1 component subunit alpha [Actinomycetota bacterium]
MKVRLPSARPPTTVDPDAKLLYQEMWRSMVLIRRFELRVNELFLRGLIPGTIHLSHGQEATAAGTCLALETNDRITITHRGHGQALAKGVTAESMMAELFGKATGCCGGRGGSLHVGDMSVGALPAIAIVGASSPIATGMALAYKRKNTGQVVANFFGDGTANKGDWHESMNLAAIWDLPVVFVCENNLWAVSTHISDTMRVEHVADRAVAYGMPGHTIDGNDPVAVYDTVATAVDRARSGGGPTLVECLTYRRGGHKRDDPATYRPTEEVDAWLADDPIERFRTTLLNGIMTHAQLKTIEEDVDAELDAAVAAAEAAPVPDPRTVEDHVYG